MRLLPRDASDDDILAAVREWVGLLAEEQYAEAYNFLFPTGNSPEQWWSDTVATTYWTPDLMATLIRNYGATVSSPWLIPQRVTPLADARGELTPTHEVVHLDPNETYDGAVGYVWFDLPLNGEWSDLTATFRLHDDGRHLRLTLDDIHVM